MSLHIAFFLLAAAPVSGPEDPGAAVAALEAQTTWNESSRLKAEELTKQRIADWGNCLRGNRTRLQHSGDTPDKVAAMVLENCHGEESDYQRALTLTYRGRFQPEAGAKLAAESVATARAKAREEMIASPGGAH